MPCSCVQSILILLEELGLRLHKGFPVAEDETYYTSQIGLLSIHKAGTRNTEAMLSCMTCSSKTENLMLLAMTCGKLAGVIERAVAYIPVRGKRRNRYGGGEVGKKKLHISNRCCLLVLRQAPRLAQRNKTSQLHR